MRYQQGGVHTAHALRELVGTVVPHIHRFEEASLRARVLRVVEITENLLRNVYLNEVVGSTVQGIPFRERPVKINLPSADNNILAGNDVGLGSPALQIPTISAIGSPEIDVKPVVTSSHTDSQVKSEPEDPPLPWGPVGFTSIYTVGGKRMTETVLAPNSKQSLPMDVNQDNSVGPSSAVPPPAPTKPQPKRVRKPEMSKLLARDLDWCKLAMAGAAQVQLPQTPASSVEPAPTPMDIDVAPFAPREQDVQAISVKQEVLPGMDREEGVSSSPRHDGVTTTETVMGDSSLPQPPPQLEPATAPASTPAAPASTLPAPVPSPASTPAVPASTLPAPAPPALAPAPASGSFHTPSDDNGVSTRATAERSPSLPPPPPVHSLQDIPSAEIRNRSLPPSAATDGESPQTSPAILPPPPNTVHDISHMPSKDTTVPPTAANSGSSLPPPTTGSQPLSGQSPAKIENSASSPGSGNDLLPPLFEPLQHAVDDVHPSTLPSQAEQSVRPEESPLDGDLAQEAFHHERVIMHFSKGDTLPRAHHVNLTVSEDMHSNVSRWVKRRVSPT
ncbi:hypothetical protein F5J12DRAFT_862128 [Pisolithus orientalis]|uniref:uncharacterized protein n=1 Tax=Pisolithus orientalis TaxID=936130 RepID=UPI00222504EB|nr:uncharacterized protein F5J12DRAFT_862128 [Pisolithus orientalis]KAI5990838.1 hypothetical protein F5J12DRAFT_862128 [Pisolithus orientalis]